MSTYSFHEMAEDLAGHTDGHRQSGGVEFSTSTVDRNGAFSDFTIMTTGPNGERHLFLVEVRNIDHALESEAKS